MKKRPEFVSIGIIIRAHGVRGELVIAPITDEFQQFEELKKISVKALSGERQFFTIDRARVRADRVILKLEEINDRDQATQLKGLSVDKHISECPELPPGEYYIFDLIGLKVKTTTGILLGEVVNVLTLPANDVYVIHDGTTEYLIPAIKDVIKKIDLKEEYILIEPLDGLL